MVAPTLEDWRRALEARGHRLARSGDGWSTTCPAHEDRHASLSIAPGDRVPVVVTCHAGCTFEAIRDALGLQREERAAAPEPAAGELPAGRHYVYRDAEGDPVLAVVRPPGEKRFHQWRPAPGGWVKGTRGVPRPRPLYRLPELLASEGRVVVVEGEKDVEAFLREYPAQVVTTWPGGADRPGVRTWTWSRADWSPLAERDVVLVADADDAGRATMEALAAHLHELGAAVRLVLPDGNDHSDVSDWIAAGTLAERVSSPVLYEPPEPPEPEPWREKLPHPAVERSAMTTAEWLLLTHPGELLLSRAEREPYDVETLVWGGVGWRRDPAKLGELISDAAARWADDRMPEAESAERGAIARYMARCRQRDWQRQVTETVAVVLSQRRSHPDRLLPEKLTTCPDSELDRGRYLGCSNGVVDLDTGELLTGDAARGAKTTRSTGTRYVADAPATAAVDALAAALGDGWGWLVASLGFALRGRPSRRVLVLQGPPRGGKSTLQAALRGALGEYAVELDPGALSADVANRPRAAAVEVRPLTEARVAFYSEPRGRISSARLKTASGGDAMTWRDLYSNVYQQREGTATIVIVGNSGQLPRLDVEDAAVRDRLHVLELPTLDPSRADPWLPDALATAAAREDLLARLVAAAREHVTPPEDNDRVRVGTDALAQEMLGEAGTWALAAIVEAPGRKLTVGEAYAAAVEEAGADPPWGVSRRRLAAIVRSIHALGPARLVRSEASGKTARGWQGVRLATADEQAELAETPATGAWPIGGGGGHDGIERVREVVHDVVFDEAEGDVAERSDRAARISEKAIERLSGRAAYKSVDARTGESTGMRLPGFELPQHVRDNVTRAQMLLDARCAICGEPADVLTTGHEDEARNGARCSEHKDAAAS